MTITIHNTTKVVVMNGVPCRVWEGETESGIPLHCFIARVAVHNSLDQSQFEHELQETRTPSAEVQAYPMRLVL